MVLKLSDLFTSSGHGKFSSTVRRLQGLQTSTCQEFQTTDAFQLDTLSLHRGSEIRYVVS
jgi:hypothetical protein